ncbi:MAG: hypothetical protein Q4G59_04440, partial [Planctomycetia bacterium]|nr:hypothetical protein [Planctomycetia bacterium]
MFPEDHRIYNNPYEEKALIEDESYLYDEHGNVQFCSYLDSFISDIIDVRLECLDSLNDKAVCQEEKSSPRAECASVKAAESAVNTASPPAPEESLPPTQSEVKVPSEKTVPNLTKDILIFADTRIDIPQLKILGIVPYGFLRDTWPKRTLDDREKVRLSQQWYELAHWAKEKSFSRNIVCACYNQAIDILGPEPTPGSKSNLKAIQIMAEKWLFLGATGTDDDFRVAIGQLELLRKPLEELQTRFTDQTAEGANVLRNIYDLHWTVSRYMGDLCYKRNRSNPAIKNYEDVLKTFRILKTTGLEKNTDALYSDACQVLYDIADVHFNYCSNYSAAMKSVTEALIYWDEIVIPTSDMMELKARLLFLKSLILIRQMEHAEALEVMDQAFEIQETLVKIAPITYTEALLEFCEERMEYSAFCRKFDQAQIWHNKMFTYYCQFLDARRRAMSREVNAKPLNRRVSVQVWHDNLWYGSEGRKWGQLLQNRGNTGLAVRIFFRALCFYRSVFDLSPYEYADNRYFLAEVLDLALTMIRLLHDIGLCITAATICQHVANLFQNLPKLVDGLPSALYARFCLDYGQVCLSLNLLSSAYEWFDKSVDVWVQLTDTPELGYARYHAIALRQRAITSNMLNNTTQAMSLSLSDNARKDLVASINGFYVSDTVSAEHIKESMKSVRTYAELLLNGGYITLTDEILTNTSTLLERFSLPAPKNDEENQGEPQLTKPWNANSDSTHGDTAPVDLQRLKNCEKDWYRIIQCFETLLDNIAIGEIQLLETCYDSCCDMLSLNGIQTGGLAQKFCNAVRSSLLRSQEKYNP